MVTAHPDDETLFGGGLILRHPGDWTVICCSVPPRDPVRAYKFFIACERLGVKGRLIPVLEPPDMSPHGLDLSDFDCVVTHGKNGEYGHKHHKDLFRWCYENTNQPLVSFSGNESFELSEEEVEMRAHALKAYDHKSPSDSKPKWEALLDRYNPGSRQEFQVWR